MTSIVSGVNYALLFGANAAGGDAATSVLSALYGHAASPSTAVSTGNPLADLKLAEQNRTKAVAREAKDPTVARDIAAFRKGIANAGGIEAALSNPAVLKVLLTANGLESQAAYPALARKVLLSDPADSKSLVNLLGNSAWLTMAKTYDFATKGLAPLRDPNVVGTLTNAYAEVRWRQSLDVATPGLSNALAFRDQAAAIASVDDILGNPVNRAVVTTALGIPREIAFQSLTAQENAISTRLDVTKLQDPKFVATLTAQYLLSMQQQAQANGTSATDPTALAIRGAGLIA